MISLAAIVLADDLAGKSPFVNPLELDDVFTPFYVRTVASIRAAGSFVFLHCCGSLRAARTLDKIMGFWIKSWDFDGFAAIQIGKNDLDLLEKEIGGLLIVGIETALLETDVPELEEKKNLQRFVARFAEQERLILSSSCGLHSSDFWGRLQRVYEGMDRNQLDDCHTTNESWAPF